LGVQTNKELLCWLIAQENFVHNPFKNIDNSIY